MYALTEEAPGEKPILVEGICGDRWISLRFRDGVGLTGARWIIIRRVWIRGQMGSSSGGCELGVSKEFGVPRTHEPLP